ncbi:MAG: ABC transporter transmembrane domain-containing protein [Burkholderiaceae bacterium]
MPLPPSDNRTAAPVALSGLRPFLRPYRPQIALALLFLLLAAAATLSFPWALRVLIDQGLARAGQNPAHLHGPFLGLFGVATALGVFSALRFYLMSWLGERITADVRNAVYSHVLRQSPAFFEHTATGEVLSRLTNDTTLVQTVLGSSLSMGLRNLVMGIGALAMLVWTQPYLMLTVAVAIAGIVLPSVWIGRRVRRLSRDSQDRVADASAVAAEVLNHVTTVQGHTAESRESARFAAATEHAFRTATRRSAVRAAMVAFVIVANAAFLLWGLFRGASAVIAGDMSAGELGQTVVYVMLVAASVAVLAEVYGDVLRAAGATERLMELLHTPPSIVDAAGAQPLPDSPQGLAVRFDDLSFHYPSRPGQPALRSVSLDIRAGETVALVGPSGAGKSTLFQLLMRFYELGPGDSGQILVQGRPVQHWTLQSLREHIATVPQDAVVFSTTARDNIRYGRPQASTAEVERAAQAAWAHDFLLALPQGYDSPLGEHGVRLSGGQRQRLAIARALLKDAPLLLLDEATSALDAESERMVQAALDAALSGQGQRTTLVIAHRLATVQRADRIVVMDQGRIVEQGRHAELLAQGGLYARLASLQNLGASA